MDSSTWLGCGTPAWQAEITSVPAEACVRIAREFADHIHDPSWRRELCGELGGAGLGVRDAGRPGDREGDGAADGRDAHGLDDERDPVVVQSFEVGLLDGVLEVRAYHQSKQAGVPLG